MAGQQRIGRRDGEPDMELISDGTAPALRIRAQGTKNAVEVVDGNGAILWSVDATGLGASDGVASPHHFGFIAWTGDPAAATNNSAPTNGTIYLARLDVTRDGGVTKLMVGLAAAAVTPTAGQNWLALLDANGNVLQSVDVSAQVTSNGLLTATIPATAVSAGIYYVAFLQNAATPATMVRGSGFSFQIMNALLSANQLRWAVNGTGLTSITNRTMSSNTSSGAVSIWAAIA